MSAQLDFPPLARKAFTCLITGASGYLGSALLRLIASERPEWDAHAAYFSIPPASGHPNAHALDIRHPVSVQHVLETIHPDVVFHTAALNAGDSKAMFETNAKGTALVARGAASIRARLVHLSSDVIFDGERGNYTELDSPNPITPYAASKAEAERAVAESGANAVIVRTSLIYGFRPLDPRTRSLLRGELTKLFVDEWRCPIWVTNLCEALIELAELDYRGVLNVAGAQRLNRYDFGVRLLSAWGGDPTRLTPARSLESSLVRPRDCSLDISLASRVLKTRLLGVDEVLEKLSTRLSG